MKIGIISAMPKEIETIHEEISFSASEVIANRTFYVGEENGIEVVLVYCGVGKVAASLTATILIEHFGVEQIVFTGLAGAVDKRLQRGDIVLAAAAYQHDYDARPLTPGPFEIAFTGQRLFDLQQHAIFNKANDAVLNFLSHLDKYVDMQELKRLQVHRPSYFQGIVASGDIFVQDVEQQKTLCPEEFSVLAVEMEGAAVAQVCDDYQMPYVLIRTISDKANGEAQASLEEFAEKLASHYASGIVQELLSLMSQE